MAGTGLVLEGGAMRGMFTNGVTDVMMENGIRYDGMIGVSAGAAFGCNYKSGQIGRSIHYNKRFCRDWRYVSVRSWLLTGDLYGAKFCYHRLPKTLDPFDVETFRDNPMEFWCVCTNADTGEAVYHKCTTGDETEMDWIRASASMPVASRPVKLDGMRLLDGGIADSIPLRFFEERGYEKNVVVLTQPESYVKQPQKAMGLIRFCCRSYPAVTRRLEARHLEYQREVSYVKKEEQAGRAFVIRPDAALNIGSICHDPDELERVYQLGRQKAEQILPQLGAFLGQ